MIRIPTNRVPTHPGEMLKEEFLTPLDLTQRELARRLRVSYPRLNELIHARRGMTPDTALRLERLLGVEAQFWLNLQLAWDLYHARRSTRSKALRGIHRLPQLRRAS
jgi:addiction module HigA family antidote